MHCVVDDLSLSGIKISTPPGGDGPEPGAMARAQLELDGGAGVPVHRVQVAGRVVRATDGECVLGVESVRPEDIEHFKRIILYNSSNPDRVLSEFS